MKTKIQVYLTKEARLAEILDESNLTASQELIRLAKIGHELMASNPKDGAYLLYLFDGNSDKTGRNKKQIDVNSEKKEEPIKAHKSNKTGFDMLLDAK